MAQIIENYADHAFNFPSSVGIKPDEMTEGAKNSETSRVAASTVREKMITFARAGKETLANGNERKVPSLTSISDETLQAMRKSPVARHWFGDGMLHVAETAEARREANRKALEAEKGAKA
jgi:hypothetical protein